jgi:hypothetical protein
MDQGLVVDAAVVIVGVAKVLDWFGWLPKKKTAADAAGELEIADRRVVRLESQLADLKAQNAKLEATRSLEPLLALIQTNGEQQAQILDRLIHHNGSFRHMERSLGQVHESLKMLAGFIAGVADVPPPVIRKPRTRRVRKSDAEVAD